MSMQISTAKNIRLLAVGAALLSALSGPMLVTADGNARAPQSLKVKSAPKYITAKSIKRAGGKYKLTVAGAGKFAITDLVMKRGYPSKCKIDVASLSRLIRRNGPAIQQAKTQEIKMKATSSGNQTICQGSGEGCTVIIAAWDPDDPILPK